MYKAVGDRWVIGGDFNMILRIEERLGEGNYSGEVEEFREVVDRLNLVNIPLLEGKWTWSNSRETPTCLRIDWFLLSNDLFRQLPGLSQKVLQCKFLIIFLFVFIPNGIICGPIPSSLTINGLRRMASGVWWRCIERVYRLRELQALYLLLNLRMRLKGGPRRWGIN